MDKKYCTVAIGNETRIYKAGTTYQQIAEEFQKKYEHQIVLVYIDKFRLQELKKTVEKDCQDVYKRQTKERELPEAYYSILSFEKQLTDDGCVIVKLFLDIDKKEQKKDVYKRQKLLQWPPRSLLIILLLRIIKIFTV